MAYGARSVALASSLLRLPSRKKVTRQTFQWLLLLATLESSFCNRDVPEYALVVVLDFLNHLDYPIHGNFMLLAKCRPLTALSKENQLSNTKMMRKSLAKMRRHYVRERKILLNVLSSIVQGSHLPGDACIKRSLSRSFPRVLLL